MPYTLTYRKPLEKQLRKAPAGMRKAIVRRILALAADPRPADCARLKGSNNAYRIRQGDYRILYEIHDDIITVEITKIGHRSDIYRQR